MTFVKSAITLTALSLLGGCTSLYIWAAHASSPMDWSGLDRIELPLKLDSLGRPGATVQILGKEMFALLDSGSAVPTFLPSAAASLGLKVKTSGKRLDENVKIQLGGGSIELTVAYVGETQGNAQLALGQEIFSQAVVDLDFNESRLTLYRPEAFTPPQGASMSVEFHYSRPTVQLQLNGSERSICAVVDTGFDSGLALSPKLVKELALPAVPGRKVVYRGVDNKRIEAAALAPLPDVALAGQHFREVPVIGVVPNDSGSCRNLLGMAVLSRYRLIFDLGNKRIWLLPRLQKQ